MADPLSIVASIAGIIAFGIKIKEIGSGVFIPTRQTPEQLHTLSTELDSLTAILQELLAILTQCPAALTTVSGSSTCNLANVLDETKTLLQATKELFDSYGRDFATQQRAWSRPFRKMSWALKEKKIDALLKQVDVFKATINLALQVAILTDTNRMNDTTERTELVANGIAAEVNKVRKLLRQVAGQVAVPDILLGSEMDYSPSPLERYFSSLESTYESMSNAGDRSPDSSTTSLPESTPPVEDVVECNMGGRQSSTTDLPLQGQGYKENADNAAPRGKRVQGLEQELEEKLQNSRDTLGPEHRATLSLMCRVAVVKGHRGKQQEAEALFREALGIRTAVLGPDHPDTLTTSRKLCEILEKKPQSSG